jgi:hypothetical protein
MLSDHRVMDRVIAGMRNVRLRLRAAAPIAPRSLARRGRGRPESRCVQVLGQDSGTSESAGRVTSHGRRPLFKEKIYCEVRAEGCGIVCRVAWESTRSWQDQRFIHLFPNTSLRLGRSNTRPMLCSVGEQLTPKSACLVFCYLVLVSSI